MDDQYVISDAPGAGSSGAATKAINYNLAELSPGEKLWIWRLSQPSNAPTPEGRGGNRNAGRMTLLEAAHTLGITQQAYWTAENDRGDPSSAALLLDRISELPEMTPALACRLARRRSGLRVDEIAHACGALSVPTFHNRERAADASVLTFWREFGFRGI